MSHTLKEWSLGQSQAKELQPVEVLAEVKWNTEQIVKEANFEHQLLPYDQLQK